MKTILLASALAALAAPFIAAATEPAPAFRDFDVKKEFAENPFTAFTGRGMLLCAGDREKSNAMTIGWGALGTLWGRNDAVTVYVAESRHTKKFLDGATHFTVMAFATPVSPEPLHGAEGYLSVVSLMRESFPDVQWKLEDMVADERTVAVRWTCTGTFTGKAPFAGIEPNGRAFSTSVMNFYVFDDDGRIVDDVAATGMLGILQGIGAPPAAL
ncbi:MAG: ester cyclase [Kiritimatiellae bacterium]|nr:ester cyclase [Kiritimatiellia bacterium]